MLTETVRIEAAEGLHMRPAGILSKEMGAFQSRVEILFGEKRINAKSVMMIVGACIKSGAEVTFEIDGEDEADALEKLRTLIQTNFGEAV